ncbi:MAG: zf-HC2 domain-containing protein [Solirubrobacteraceae bacterium]
MGSKRSECGMDPEAYVLGELTVAERAAFRRHLANCAACRQQVDELESAIAMMPLMAQHAEPAPARPSMKDEIRGQARAQVAQARARAARSPQPARRSRRPVLRRPGTGVAALFAAMLLTILISYMSSSTTTYQAAVSWSPGGAILKVSDGKGELFVTGMPAAGAGRTYEIWLQHGKAAPLPTSARFEVDGGGRADVAVPGDLSDVARVLVSSEPRGGSRAITETPVLVATLNTSN